MKGEIARLKADGWIPIATLQYFETYSMKPANHQVEAFKALSDAGAVIVSGSQAHFPQGFALNGDRFIHYGLGNLFFDQMRLPDYAGVQPLFDNKNLPVAGTRLEFLDRHTFYDGRYMGTEVLTAMLEDYSRPRPMTPEERSAFLKDTFDSSGW
jgi:poly-gamma-glutamate synthesis protein (capsule biosynthesis protein)